MKPIILAVVAGMLLLPSRSPAQERSDIVFAGTMARAIRLISKEHFTPASDAELTNWAIHGLFEAVKKPIPPKIAERLKNLDKPKAESIGELLRDARAYLGQRMELAERRDLNICVEAISRKLLPSATPEQRLGPHAWNNDCYYIRFDYKGVGLKLEVDPQTKMLRVITPIFNGPGYVAGIRGGDIITAIRHHTDRDGTLLVGPDSNGKIVPMPKVYSTTGMSVEEANRLLLGKQGTRVTLMVIPAQQGQK